jgi:hypothetical protein
MLIIFEVMGLDENIIIGIDPSPLAFEENLITFYCGNRYGLLVIRQIVSNELSSKITKLKTQHNM